MENDISQEISLFVRKILIEILVMPIIPSSFGFNAWRALGNPVYVKILG